MLKAYMRKYLTVTAVLTLLMSGLVGCGYKAPPFYPDAKVVK